MPPTSLAIEFIVIGLLLITAESAQSKAGVPPISSSDVNDFIQKSVIPVIHLHGKPHRHASTHAYGNATTEFQLRSISKSEHDPSLIALGGLMLVNMLSFALLVFLGQRDSKDSHDRDASLDHIKWILVGLVYYVHIVVFHNDQFGKFFSSWHEIERLGAQGGIAVWKHPVMQIFTFVQIFMMPTFCFLSGYFSRNYVTRNEHTSNNDIQVIVPDRRLRGTLINILLACILYRVLEGNIAPALECLLDRSHEPSRQELTALQHGTHGFFEENRTSHLQEIKMPSLQFSNITSPSKQCIIPGSLHSSWQVLIHPIQDIGVLWYLVALVSWRLVLPFWSCLRMPITCSFVVAICPVALPSLPGTMKLAFGFFPFFVCGLQVSSQDLDQYRYDRTSQFSGFFALALLLFLMRYKTVMQSMYTLAHYPDDFSAPITDFWYGTTPLIYYPTCLLGTGAFLAAAQPVFGGDWGSILNRMSTRSLYAYMGHMMAFKYAICIWDWKGYMLSLSPWTHTLWIANISFAFLMFISSWPVYFILSTFCEPPLDWIFKAKS